MTRPLLTLTVGIFLAAINVASVLTLFALSVSEDVPRFPSKTLCPFPLPVNLGTGG